jgi:hypothetical protein
MSNQITTAFVQQYTTKVALLSQQVGSRLRMCVTTGSYTGKAAVPVEQLGAVEPQVLATRHADTPVVETPHARRWVSPTPYGGGDYFDEEDAVQALLNPTNDYARNQAAGMGRAIDRAIITAALGTSKIGADGTTNEAFDTANFQIAAGGAGLTIQKIVQAREKIAAANVDPIDEFYLVGRQRHITNLLSAGVVNNYVTPVVTSRDFFEGNALMSATLPLIAGFRFIQTEVISSTTVLAFAKSGLHLGIWKDISSSIDRIPSKNNNWLVQTKAIFGATRLEQAKIVDIQTT